MRTEARSIKQISRWLWAHNRGCRIKAIVNVGFGLVQVAAGLLTVELMRQLTDIAAKQREGNLVFMIGVFAAVLVAELMLSGLRTWLTAVLGVKAQNVMQAYFYDRVLRGQWSGVERLHSGDVFNRMFGDVKDIVALMADVLPAAFVVVVQLVASFVYLYSLDKSIALLVVVISPLFLLLSRLYFRVKRKIIRKIKSSNSDLQASIQESVLHRMVVKVLEMEARQLRELKGRQNLLVRLVKRNAVISIYTKSIVQLGFSGTWLVAFSWGLFQLHDGAITIGVLFAFGQLVGRIQRPLLDLMRMVPSFVDSMTSVERLMELEEHPLEPEVESVRMDGPLGIRLTDVDYNYQGKRRSVLKSFSYDFRPGSVTAVIGETGAGKTTIMRMILALIAPRNGKVEMYDQKGNTQTVGVQTRCNCSYVPQGNTLMCGTIRQNLLMGNPKATTADMKRALETAMADFVLELPDGLETKCGESGGGLSEGQAQRIAIARALLRPCGLLLLDEATSALDEETEKSLLRKLGEECAGKTVIFITHRQAVHGFANDVLKVHN